jgi:hypothetical protein
MDQFFNTRCHCQSPSKRKKEFNAEAEKPRPASLASGSKSFSSRLGLQVGSRQFFKKLDLFPQQLIDYLADILAFPTGNARDFTLQFRF